MQKNLNSVDKVDKKISIAIMSSFVALALQYFILVAFNLFNTSLQSVVQTGSMIIVAIIFINVFPYVFKRSKMILIITYYASMFIFLSQLLFFEDNRTLILELVFPFFAMSLLAFIYSSSIKDLKIFKKIMLQASYIIFVLGFLLSILIFTGIAQIETYSMTLSYYMLLPSIMFLNKVINNFSALHLVSFIISLGIIISLGSRGAIACVVVFIVLKLILYLKHLTNIRILKFISISFVVMIPLLYINYVIEYLFIFLVEKGVYSRSLDLFLTDATYDSGREELFGLVLSEILGNIFFGLGLGGDRLILNGSYVHNIILEVLINFGLIIGSILIILYITLVLYSILTSKQDNEILLIWFSIGVVPLFVSSSYLTDLDFWIFNGITLGGLLKGYYNTEKEVVT